MDFETNNLNAEDVKKTLELLKSAIEMYKREYQNKLYKFSTSNGKINLSIHPYLLPHILGFDINARNSWLDYIGKNRINSFEWFEEFANSGEFIEYMIFGKFEDPLVNFYKMRYKTEHFLKMNINNNPAFFFNSGGYMPLHIGIIIEKKIISFKIIKEQKNDINSIYIPRSLYIYDDIEGMLNGRNLRDFIIPCDLEVYKKKKSIDMSQLYSEESQKELMKKINIFTK